MKRSLTVSSLLTMFVFAGCSASVTNVATLPNTPPPITGSVVVATTLPITDEVPYIASINKFLASVSEKYGHALVPMSDEHMIDTGELWCGLLSEGMTSEDVESRINEGAIDNDDANLHRAIVYSAVLYLCPENQYKWE